MHAFLESLEEERRRRFRRFVAVSAAVHAGALLLLIVAPSPRIRTELPAVVRVDLVAASAPPSAAPPAAKPAPPKPAPPKPAPRPPEKVVIPEKPAPPKPEPKPEPKPQPQAKPEPEPEREPAEPAQEQVGYEELLAELRAKEQAEGGGAVGAEAGARSGPPGGPGVRVSPEVMAWMRRAKVHVTRAWVLAPGFRAQPLQTQIEVELGPGGEVRGTRVVRGSGNPWFDESAERAVQKASPLPQPPEAGTWAFVFEPGDAL
ncbi:MAG: energy transducer TonB [Myxococcota bacterium]|nr:energy transducer TonB [Myxococcota bacterium]